MNVPDVVMVINFLTPSDNRKPNNYRIFLSVDAVHQTFGRCEPSDAETHSEFGSASESN